MNDFTIKDIADLLGVSKTTIRKVISADNIDFDYVKSNRQYFGIDKTKKIISSIKKDFDFSLLETEVETANSQTENSQTKSEKSQTETAKSQTESENIGNQTENSQTENSQTRKPKEEQTELAALYQLMAIVQKQLEEKDKQLAVKDKQIQDLSDRLQEAMQLTHGQQFIAAADKAAMLQDKAANDIIEEEKTVKPQEDIKPVDEKKSIWKKIFKK